MKLTLMYKVQEVDGEKVVKTCKAMSSQVDLMKKAGWSINEPEVKTDDSEAEKLAAEKLAAEKLAAEKLAAEKLAAEKLAAEKASKEKVLK